MMFVSFNSNTTGFTSGTGTANQSGAHMSSPKCFKVVRVAQSLDFCVVFCGSLFVLLSFSFGYCMACLLSFGYCMACLLSFGYCMACLFFNLQLLINPIGIFKLLLTYVLYIKWLFIAEIISGNIFPHDPF